MRDASSTRRADVLSLVALILFLGFTFAVHVAWISANHAPPKEDDNMQLMKSLQFLNALHRAGTHFLEPLLLGRGVDFYPPLTYAVTSLFYAALGPAQAVGRCSLLPFVALLAFSTYGIGRRLWGPAVGLAAACAAISAPTFVHYAHSYFIDAPLTAVVAFNMYCLLCADEFRDGRGTWLWGLSIGLGLMTKWTFALWVFVPNLLAVVACARRDPQATGLTFTVATVVGFEWFFLRARHPITAVTYREPDVVALYMATCAVLAVILLVMERRPALRGRVHLAWGLLIGFGMGLPWYMENFQAMTAGTSMLGELHARDAFDRKVLDNWSVVQLMLWPAPLLLAAGALVGCWRAATREATTWILIGGVGSFSLMCVLFIYADRYIMPVLVFAALLAFAWLQSLGRWAVVPLLIALPLWAWQLAGCLPQVRAGAAAALGPARVARLPLPAPLPEAEDYAVDDVLDAALRSSRESDRAVIWVMNNRDANLVQARVYEYVAMERALNVEIVHAELDDLDLPWAREQLRRGTHFLMLWNRQTPQSAWLKLAEKRAGWSLRPLTSFRLPQGFTASLYLRRRAASTASSEVQP